MGCRFDSCHQLQKDLKTENVLGSFAVIGSDFIAVKRRKIENDRKRENPWKKWLTNATSDDKIYRQSAMTANEIWACSRVANGDRL